jgi:hypothetical protein
VGSIFKSTNIELTNVEHHTNITNLHKYVNNCKTNQTNKMDIEKIIETSHLLNVGGVDVNQ